MLAKTTYLSDARPREKAGCVDREEDAVFPSAHLDFYLPCDPRTVGHVRAMLRRLAPGWAFASVLDTVELVASELVTNVLVHSQDHAWFSVSLEERVVRLNTIDASRQKPEPRIAGPDDESGRGLALVQALCFRFGVEHLDGGKRVWAEIARPEPEDVSKLADDGGRVCHQA
jgi:anti-sigma regulatory factor (Ser/Thr protein kinase)